MAWSRRPLLLRLAVETIDVPQPTVHVIISSWHTAGGSSTASCSCISCAAAARSNLFSAPGQIFARYGMAQLRRRRELVRVVSLNTVKWACTRALRAPVLARSWNVTLRHRNSGLWQPPSGPSPTLLSVFRNLACPTPRIEILSMGSYTEQPGMGFETCKDQGSCRRQDQMSEGPVRSVAYEPDAWEYWLWLGSFLDYLWEVCGVGVLLHLA